MVLKIEPCLHPHLDQPKRSREPLTKRSKSTRAGKLLLFLVTLKIRQLVHLLYGSCIPSSHRVCKPLTTLNVLSCSFSQIPLTPFTPENSNQYECTSMPEVPEVPESFNATSCPANMPEVLESFSIKPCPAYMSVSRSARPENEYDVVSAPIDSLRPVGSDAPGEGSPQGPPPHQSMRS